jgi:hypothetical protein
MKLWCPKICALLLSLAMMPGAFEVIETAAHLVTEGHMAHAVAEDDHHSPTGPEHGCTPTFHFCGCHTSMTFLSPQNPPAINLRVALLADPLGPDLQLTGFWPTIDRPPRV